MRVYDQRKEMYFAELCNFLDSDFSQKFILEECRLSCESELIMGHELLYNKYCLIKKSNPRGPDFLLDYHGKRVWVEVVTPKEGKYLRYKSVDKVNDGTSQKINFDNCKIKIASVIKDKKEILEKYIQDEVCFSSDIKVICVNTCGLDDGPASCPFIVSVLFGIEEVCWVDQVTYKTGNEFIGHNPIIKSIGSKIQMGFFVQKEYESVDGVLWFNYSLGSIVPDKCEVQFFLNQNRRDKIGDLFSCWPRVFYEKGCLMR